MIQLIRNYILTWFAERILSDLLANDLTAEDKAVIDTVLQRQFTEV